MNLKATFSIVILFAIGIPILLLSCNGTVDPEGEFLNRPLTIRSGTSFGMCIGHCQKEVEITEQNVAVTLKSFRSKEQYPDKTCSIQTDSDDWQTLGQSLNREAFYQLPDTIGCPDCADGGAEWIEIEENDKKYRVTFEYGTDISQIGPLLTKVRALRGGYIHRCQ
jgi:hypothetical protein